MESQPSSQIPPNQHSKRRRTVRWVMLERERWLGVPNGLQEGTRAKEAVLHSRDAQAAAAF